MVLLLLNDLSNYSLLSVSVLIPDEAKGNQNSTFLNPCLNL
jgi:hypothetical protein